MSSARLEISRYELQQLESPVPQAMPIEVYAELWLNKRLRDAGFDLEREYQWQNELSRDVIQFRQDGNDG